MVRLYFVHPLEQDGHHIASVIADEGAHDERSAMLHRVRQYVTDDGREIDVDGGAMTVFHHNIAAVLSYDEPKEAH